MKTFTKIWGIASLATAALLMSATASAAVTCPVSPTGNAVELTNIVGGPPTCVPAGTGDGNENAFPFFDDKNLLWKIEADGGAQEGSGPNPFVSFSPDPIGEGALSGSFELIAGLTNHYLVFKFGEGQNTPNLITFAINGMTEADWKLIPCTGTDTGTAACNGLSHVSIWGPGVTVPEPGTLALMGLGLVAVGYRVRRRQKV